MIAAWLALACAPPAPPPGLSVAEVEARVRPGTADAGAWAGAVRRALVASGVPVDVDHVCQTLAIIEQESGYEADPAVPGLGPMARDALVDALADRLGLLGDDAATLVLAPIAPGASSSFDDRLKAVRTEQQLDRLYQDLLEYHASRVPAVGDAIQWLFPRRLDALNPVGTAGSMQVSVAWAQEHPLADGRPRDEVRAALYTLDGGVLFGTARLFVHDADYDRPIYRFADYNAGLYASRNAAFQEQLAALAGAELALDGDLLAYDRRDRPEATSRTAAALRAWATAAGRDADDAVADLALEKSRDFEATATWAAVRAASAEAGREPAYARVPAVTLDSPKLRGTWTTATFAERVERRYTDCLAR